MFFVLEKCSVEHIQLQHKISQFCNLNLKVRTIFYTSPPTFFFFIFPLLAWMTTETERINSLNLSEEDRLAALAILLQHETKIIQTIDKLKIEAKSENEEARIQDMLQKVLLSHSFFYPFALLSFSYSLHSFFLSRCPHPKKSLSPAVKKHTFTRSTPHVLKSLQISTQPCVSRMSRWMSDSIFFFTSSGQ